MTQPFQVRPATVADYEQTLPLFEELDALHRQHVPWMFCEPRSPARTVLDFEQLCTSEESTVLVAGSTEPQRQLLGLAVAFLRRMPDLPIIVPQQYVLLDGLVVAASSQRLGIGERLVVAVEAWAHAKGARWVQLEVHAFNTAAEQFYGGHGYLPFTRKLQKPLA
jgi:GNAT superfamily N-acetyltransferase